jgi:hypothetical protein
MQIDAVDDVVAVEKRSPGDAQQVRQPGVDKNVVHRLRIVHVVEEGAEPANPTGVETAGELADGILLQQGSRVPGHRDPGDESGPEHRPPKLVVGGLIDQDVILTAQPLQVEDKRVR